MKTIDLDGWSRAGQYRFFRSYGNPHYAITAPLDVTRLMTELKPRGVSPFIAVLHAVMAGANAVPEFRTRFRGDQVVMHDVVGASYTVPSDQAGFVFCETAYMADWADFDRQARADIARAREGGHQGDLTEGEDGWIFLSCLPWLEFTGMTHPVSGPDDCIPRIAWGRIGKTGDRMTMPVAVQVHHALVDGAHVGALLAEAQTALDRIDAG